MWLLVQIYQLTHYTQMVLSCDGPYVMATFTIKLLYIVWPNLIAMSINEQPLIFVLACKVKNFAIAIIFFFFFSSTANLYRLTKAVCRILCLLS